MFWELLFHWSQSERLNNFSLPYRTNSSTTVPNTGGDTNIPVNSMIGNPVGELQELTQKRLWPPPIYDFTSEQGPPHAREFICTVRLWKFTEQGIIKHISFPAEICLQRAKFCRV